jgi:hypothetical protein
MKMNFCVNVNAMETLAMEPPEPIARFKKKKAGSAAAKRPLRRSTGATIF